MFLIFRIPRSRFVLELMLLLCRFWVLECAARSQLLRLFNDGSTDTVSSFVISPEDLVVGTLDTIVCSGSLAWLFSPAWDAVKLILQEDFGFICPFVVIDPTDLGALTAIARNLLQDMLTTSYLSPTQISCLFTLGY